MSVCIVVGILLSLVLGNCGEGAPKTKYLEVEIYFQRWSDGDKRVVQEFNKLYKFFFCCFEEKAFYIQTKAKHTWFGILQTIAFD